MFVDTSDLASDGNNLLKYFEIFTFLVNYINKNKQHIIEGTLRCQELSEYLDKVKAKRTVWLSEDGSGIVTKICYDSTSNQMVGLVLPLNTESGMPISFSYMPKSTKDIELFSKAQKSTLVYMVMAQPLKYGTPPFILLMFGTNNKFTTFNVTRRWEYTKLELEK